MQREAISGMAHLHSLRGILQLAFRLGRKRRGFTLVELLIVVAVIAVLVAMLIPNFVRARAQSQVAASKSNLKNLGTALEQYHVDTGAYPIGFGPAGEKIRPGVAYACHKGTAHGKHSNCGSSSAILAVLVPTYIRAIPMDPCTDGQYLYQSANGSTYSLEIDYPADILCDSIIGTTGDLIDLTYTPDGGLREGP